MKYSENKRAPSLGGWVIAAGAGVVAAAVAFVVGHLGYTQSGFIGIAIFLLAGLVLGMYWGPSAVAEPKSAAAPMTVVPAAIAVAPVAAAPAMAEAVPAAFVSAPMAAADPVPAKLPRGAKPKVAAKAPAKPIVAKAEAKPVAAKPVSARAPKAKKPDGPLRLSAPRKGKADDLKEIEGIGPALEKLCNSLGFYHFDQIAGWSEADVAWVDANMKTFKGRIVRDKWIAQSNIIITEGLEAFRVRAQTNNY